MSILTREEATVIAGVIDAGIRSVGIQLHKNNSMVLLSSALDKIEAQANTPPTPPVAEDGNDKA